MPALQAQMRPLGFLLFPPRCRQSVRLLHFQPSERRCLEKKASTESQFRSDLGLIDGDHPPQPHGQLPGMNAQG